MKIPTDEEMEAIAEEVKSGTYIDPHGNIYPDMELAFWFEGREDAMSLLVCGKCGYDWNADTSPDRASPDAMLRKVVFAGEADILCLHCIAKLEEEKNLLARKHLGTRRMPE